MTTKLVGVWPVNEVGEIVTQAGVGTSNVVGYIPQSSIPTDSSTNKAIIKFPDSIGSSVGTIVNNNGVLTAVIPVGATYTSIQWLKVSGGVATNIAGATTLTYTLQPTDTGTLITYRLTGLNPVSNGYLV